MLDVNLLSTNKQAQVQHFLNLFVTHLEPFPYAVPVKAMHTSSGWPSTGACFRVHDLFKANGADQRLMSSIDLLHRVGPERVSETPKLDRRVLGSRKPQKSESFHGNGGHPEKSWLVHPLASQSSCMRFPPDKTCLSPRRNLTPDRSVIA